MYQRKLAQWGLEKKHKAPEMRAILRITRQREAAGRESIFYVRGRRVDFEEVCRYFKRKGQDPSQLHLRDTSPMPSTVTVETPSPARPPPNDTTDDEDSAHISFALPPHQSATQYPTPETEGISTSAAASSTGSSIHSDSVVSTPPGSLVCQPAANYLQLSMPIAPTFDDQCSRYLLHLTQCFFDVVVPPRFYSQDGANTVLRKPWRRTMSSWSRATSEGHELMQSGQADKTGWELRNKAYASVKKHITNRSPIILFRYFEIIRTIRNSRDPLDQVYLRFTLEFVLQMAETVLHPSHPIRLLTRLLLHPQAYQIIGPLAQQGFQKSLEILFQKCGLQHPRILYVLDSWTQTLLDEHQYEDAIRKAESYLERANSIQGTFYSYESCQALRMMGDAYAAQNQFDRATEKYNKAFAMQRYLPSSEDRGVVGVKTKRGLAAIAMQQKRFKHAEEDLQEALQIGKDTFGEDDVEVKLVQKDLNALKEKCEEVRRHRRELVYRPLNA